MAEENGTHPLDALKGADVGEAIAVQSRSVEQESRISPNVTETSFGNQQDTEFLIAFANHADGIIPWGTRLTARDRQLRAYVPSESVLSGAVASVTARNASMPWSLEATPEMLPLRDELFDILQNSEWGKGWANFISKVSWDLYTQDKGAFVELVRLEDRPDSPIVMLNHLDAVRCWSTGRRAEPVLYRDVNGKTHRLKWWQVHQLAEMPTPHETLYGVQTCAVTRVLRASQVWRNITTYMDEKTGGRHTRALYFVNGVTEKAIQSAVDKAAAVADSALRERFSAVPIVASVQKDVDISVSVMEIAGLPDGFDSEQQFNEYLTILALGFLVDFQEFAPLPGGNLGTSTQSEILAGKARAKGPATFRKLIENMLNQVGILPDGVTFRYDVPDPETDSLEAETFETRSKGIKNLSDAGVLSPDGGRQVALDFGMIPEELFLEENARDLTGPASLSNTEIPIQDKAVSTVRRSAEVLAGGDVEAMLDLMEKRLRSGLVAADAD